LAEKDLKRLPKDFPIPKDVELALEQVMGPREKSLYEKFCSFSGRVFGGLTSDYKLSDQTARELRDAGLRVTSKDWAAGMFFSLIVPIVPFLLLWVLLGFSGGNFFGLLYLPLLGFLLGGLAMMVFQFYPSSMAATRKSEAQSKAINTIMLLSFSLYHRPDLRGATVYAADTSEGKLAEDLQKGLLDMDERRRYETVRHLLTVIANDWGRVDDNVRQAIFDILRSTGTKDEAARVADVSKAPARVLEGAEEQLDKRLGGLVMPTLAFLTFGSLAIIATIGLSPIFSIIGIQLVDLKFFVGMALTLIASFLVFTFYMGRRRPVTIQPPRIPEDDPRLPPKGKVKLFGKFLPSWLPPVLLFSAIVWPGVLYLLGVSAGVLGVAAQSFTTLWIIWAVAAALSVYAYLYSSQRAKVREEERMKLVDWGNCLNTIGSRMIDGKPVAKAMADAAELMEGSSLSKELKDASERMEDFGMNLHDALFGGRKRSSQNPLIKSFIEIISRIRRDSEAAAGRACMMAAEFLRTLHRVERRFREKIDEAMGNLWLVAVILIPVVCAMSVWVMDFMSGMKFTITSQTAAAGVTGIPFLLGAMEASELAFLRLTMGLTAIILSVVIARYISSIRAPGDKVELWSSVFKSTVVSAAVFTVTSFLFTVITVGGI
jgi:hypothetical protein